MERSLAKVIALFFALPKVLNFTKTNSIFTFHFFTFHLKCVPLHPVRVRWGRVKCVRTYAASRKNP